MALLFPQLLDQDIDKDIAVSSWGDLGEVDNTDPDFILYKLDFGETKMGEKLLGIDVSKWQGLWDWESAEAAGVHFAFIRAGSINNATGECYEDEQFKNNALIAPEFMPVGFYWYFRPNHSAAKQADYFSELINPENWLLPPVMDLESDGGLSPHDVSLAAEKFATRVYKNTTVWPLLYSRSYFLHDNTEPNPIWDNLDLWIARYTLTKLEPWGNPGDAAKLKPPYYDDWTFWQYSMRGEAIKYGGLGPPNGDDDVDLNWFNGDLDEFHKYLGIYQKPPLPETIGVRLDVDGTIYEGHVPRID